MRRVWRRCSRSRTAEGGERTTRRSLIFVAVTGEEKGLLGSRYFAAHPTGGARSMVADLNMDMFLPLYPLGCSPSMV